VAEALGDDVPLRDGVLSSVLFGSARRVGLYHGCADRLFGQGGNRIIEPEQPRGVLAAAVGEGIWRAGVANSRRPNAVPRPRSTTRRDRCD
jgi:hypothetical protein